MSPELRAGLGRGRVAFAVLGAVIALFLLLPLAIVVPTSWTSGRFLQFPPHGFSLQWYGAVFDGDTWTDAALVSLRVSLPASLLAIVIGTAAALGLRRLVGGYGPRVMRSVLILPFVVPYVSYALGLHGMFQHLPEVLEDTTLPLMLGQAMITFPLAYVIVASALARIDPRLTRAAATLGARWPTIMWRIELPLIRLAILGAWVFVFAIAFEEATLAIFLAPIDEVTLPQQLFREAEESIAPTLSAVSTLITMLAILILGIGSLILSLSSRRRGGTA